MRQGLERSCRLWTIVGGLYLPTNLVPYVLHFIIAGLQCCVCADCVLSPGVQALHERHAAQQRVAAKVDSLLQRTRRELHALADEREASFALRLRHYTTRQLQLSHRIVRLAAAIESQRVVRALPQGGAYGEPPLNPSEQAWVDELRMLASAVRQPGQGRARLHELSSELQLHATGGGAGTRLDAALAASGGTTGATRLNLAALREWLERHQANLKRLLDIQEQLQRDAKATLAAAF